MTSHQIPLPHVLGLCCLWAVGCSDDHPSAVEPGAEASGDTAGPTGTTAPSTSTSGTSGNTSGNASAAGGGVATSADAGGVPGDTTGAGTTGATTTTPSTTTQGGIGSSSTATNGSVPALPVDCSAISAHDDWELCDSGSDFCAAVFSDGAGCAALCASVGLPCAEVWEDAEDSCGPDTSRSALSCSSESGHESDYCLCQGAAAATSAGAATSGDSDGAGGTGGSSSTSASDGSGASTSTSDGAVATATSGGTGGSGPSTNPGCEEVMGDAGTVDSTIVVESGETFDGQCRRYRAGSALGDGSQDEDQDPVFRLEGGARLINVVLGAPAADGIHTYGDVTLENIVWEDIGEDAMTIKETGTVVLDGGGAFNGEDKVFQINAPSTFRVSNFTARSAGKFIRQNGDTTFRVDVFIDRCDISDMDEAIFRTDSSSSTVSMTNTRYSDIGDALFIGVSAGNITTSDNSEY